MIRVLIADDNAVVRSSLEALLSVEDDMLLVGESATGPQTLDLAANLSPDVVLMDLTLPELDGVEMTLALRDRLPAVRVIVLASFRIDNRLDDAVEAGAMACLEKSVSADLLADVIRRVAAGEKIGRIATPTLSP